MRRRCVCCRDEIPHGIAVTIEQMKERDNGIFDIEATIVCERDSHKGIIIGKGGAMLKRIGSQARREIENLMGRQGEPGSQGEGPQGNGGQRIIYEELRIL